MIDADGRDESLSDIEAEGEDRGDMNYRFEENGVGAEPEWFWDVSKEDGKDWDGGKTIEEITGVREINPAKRGSILAMGIIGIVAAEGKKPSVLNNLERRSRNSVFDTKVTPPISLQFN